MVLEKVLGSPPEAGIRDSSGPDAVLVHLDFHVTFADAGKTKHLSRLIVSHITVPGAVMSYSIGPGVEKRTPLDQELGIFEDIGWTLMAQQAPNPSPAPLPTPLRGRMSRRRAHGRTV